MSSERFQRLLNSYYAFEKIRSQQDFEAVDLCPKQLPNHSSLDYTEYCRSHCRTNRWILLVFRHHCQIFSPSLRLNQQLHLPINQIQLTLLLLIFIYFVSIHLNVFCGKQKPTIYLPQFHCFGPGMFPLWLFVIFRAIPLLMSFPRISNYFTKFSKWKCLEKQKKINAESGDSTWIS